MRAHSLIFVDCMHRMCWDQRHTFHNENVFALAKHTSILLFHLCYSILRSGIILPTLLTTDWMRLKTDQLRQWWRRWRHFIPCPTIQNNQEREYRCRCFFLFHFNLQSIWRTVGRITRIRFDSLLYDIFMHKYTIYLITFEWQTQRQLLLLRTNAFQITFSSKCNPNIVSSALCNGSFLYSFSLCLWPSQCTRPHSPFTFTL